MNLHLERLQPVAWAVIFTDDVDLHRMSLFKEQARAEQYAGDPMKPHDDPKEVRALVFRTVKGTRK